MSDLLLVPTAQELRFLKSHLQQMKQDWSYQLCGFGPIASAARTGALLARYKPQRVLLVGIAGTYNDQKAPVKTACRFDSVACYGVGVGSGDEFQTASEMGWNQFSDRDAQPKLRDVIPLTSSFVQNVPCHGQLLTACAASANDRDAQRRQRVFPNAIAEDMEGYGVAFACALAGIPLQIVRGISNVVGDRDHSNWSIEESLFAAANMVTEIAAWKWIPTES